MSVLGISPWQFAASALLSLFGSQQARQGEEAANRLAERQVGLQERIANRYLGRAEQLYDPLEEEALARLAERMRTSPFYAPAWLGQARRLRQPLTLNY